MRSLLVLIALASGAGYVAIRHLPASEAEAARPAPARVQEIQSVTIEGALLPLADLRGLLGSRRGALLSDATLTADRAALEAELVGRGHLGAKVAPATVSFGPDGGAYVTFEIVQGPRYKLRHVTLIGATDRDAVVTLSTGEDADTRRIERARQVVAETLARRGMRGEVTVAMRVDHLAGMLDVELAIAR